MPVLPSTDQGFSYETNIAPYASRFFTEIGNDPNLRASDRMQLQGTLLGGATDIALAREKLDQERQQSALQRLQIQHTQSALEEARLRRMRMEDADAQDAAVTQDINSVVYADASPEERHQALAELQLKHAGTLAYNPALAHRFDAAFKAVPKPEKAAFTPEKLTDLYAKLAEHPQGYDIINSGDPALIGLGLAQVNKLEEQRKEAAAALKSDTADQKRVLRDLLFTEPEYQKIPGEDEPRWLEPGVHNKFKLLMEHAATPDELKKFNAEKDDRKRAEMVSAVQMRELRKGYPAGQEKPVLRGSDLVR